MQPSDQTVHQLPLPFGATSWSKRHRPAVQAFWDWHLHLAQPPEQVLAEKGVVSEEDRRLFFEKEGDRAEEGLLLSVLPDAVTHVAYEMCERNSVSRTLLAEQVRAAARFAGPIRFGTFAALQDFILRWAGAHAQALASLAGYKHSWQLRHVDELATAFFLVGRLVRLPADLDRDHLFIPLDELANAGVTLDQLRAGTMTEAMQRLLWKQAIRIRDAFAQGQALINDLEGREARQFKRWWLGGLEVIHEIERRKYDLWKRPITLSQVQRFRVSLQALMGRATFR